MDVSEKASMTEWFEWREAPPTEFAVLGDPVAHSLSPTMQMAAFQALSLPYRYIAIRVPLEEFGAALDRLAALAYVGLNVTVPLKEAAFRWAKTADALSGKIKAANTLRVQNRQATNTDAPGILDVLGELGIGRDAPVLLLGAGGAARAVAAALHEAGYPFALYNRSRDRAEGLVSEWGLSAPVLAAPDPHGFQVVINATSASLSGEALGVDWRRAMPGTIALDLAYSKAATPFMVEAASFGIPAHDGKSLLVAQGARSLEWWLGIRAPRSAMLKAIQ